MTKKQIYTARADKYAEAHCISDYRVKGSNLIYNVSSRGGAHQPRCTVQHTVDLNTGTEINVRTLGKYDAAGEYNQGVC